MIEPQPVPEPPVHRQPPLPKRYTAADRAREQTFQRNFRSSTAKRAACAFWPREVPVSEQSYEAHRQISHFSPVAFSLKCGYLGKPSIEYTEMHEILLSQGYELVDDAWDARGHRTYVHNGNADRQHMVQLEKKIRPAGWVRAQDQMRMFRHKTTSDIIEIEPGGTKVGGHFLHHMKWESM